MKKKTHKRISEFRDAYVGCRLPIALDTLLSRAAGTAGTNKSKFIRTAIQHYICTVTDDAETFANAMEPV